MEIRGRCPACQAKYKVAVKYAGRRLRCPKCQAQMEVPRREVEELESPPQLTAPAESEGKGVDFSDFRIQVKAKKAAARGNTGRFSARGNPWSRATFVLVGCGCAALLAVATMLLVAFLPSGKAPARPAATAQTPKLPAMRAAHPRSQPEQPSSLANKAASAEMAIGSAVESPAIRGFAGWLQSLEVAKRLAFAEKKDMLIVFGCSDSQLATQELAQTLKEPELKAVVEGFVRVVIDFPRTPTGYELIEDMAQNRQLFEEYSLERLPALALADDDGRPYWLVRRFEDGFGSLATQLARWQENKVERDRMLATAAAGSTQERVAAAARAVEWFEEHDLWRFYGSEIGEWARLAERVDPENKSGTLESFFEPQWFLHVARVRTSDAQAAAQVAAELEPWVTRKFRDPDRGAKLHLVAAKLLQSARQFDDAARQLEHATHYTPLDGQLVAALRDVRHILEHKDVVGSGTGFLVSAAGYVLTSQHVVAGEGQIVVRVPGVKAPIAAEVVASDDGGDMALLKVVLPQPANLRPLALRTDPVRRGSAVAGFGFPLGETLGAGLKLSAGTISAVPDAAKNRYLLDLTVNPGNSGGPLCDRRGNVVGMISEKTGTDGIEDSYGLAIPANDLLKFLDEHLPAAAKRSAADTSDVDLAWDKVDERVSSGVLMVVKKK
jgi:S1-C subfamily serine protease